jgi:hypothetical protein
MALCKRYDCILGKQDNQLRLQTSGTALEYTLSITILHCRSSTYQTMTAKLKHQYQDRLNGRLDMANLITSLVDSFDCGILEKKRQSKRRRG